MVAKAPAGGVGRGGITILGGGGGGAATIGGGGGALAPQAANVAEMAATAAIFNFAEIPRPMITQPSSFGPSLWLASTSLTPAEPRGLILRSKL